MRRITFLFNLLSLSWAYPLHNPFEYIYPLAYPHSAAYSDINYGYNYAPQLQTYSSYIPSYTNEYIQDYAATGYSSIPEIQPTLNVMAELPYAVSNEFSVVPMFVVSKNTMNMITQGQITSVSEDQPAMTIKIGDNNSIKCTPAVRMVLEKPIIVGSLKNDVLFPTEVQILHGGVRIPIRIGAVIAPVLPQTYVSQATPVAVRVVYAIPTKPLKITIKIEQDGASQTASTNPQSAQIPDVNQRFPDVPALPKEDKNQQFSGNQPTQSQNIQSSDSFPLYIEKLPNANKDQAFNNNFPPEAEQFFQKQNLSDNGFGALSDKPDYVNNADAVFVPDQEAVVVESESQLPPKNVTVIDFPQEEAEPHLEVDEEDDELVNRNPPLVLAPAGIVQSTQPESHVEAFHNDKESPYLETLREDAKKKRL